MANASKLQDIKVEDIDIALGMLKKYIDNEDINPLVAALEILKTDPQNHVYQVKVSEVFDGLGFLQGAALTYAPYLNIFVSDDPHADF